MNRKTLPLLRRMGILLAFLLAGNGFSMAQIPGLRITSPCEEDTIRGTVTLAFSVNDFVLGTGNDADGSIRISLLGDKNSDTVTERIVTNTLVSMDLPSDNYYLECRLVDKSGRPLEPDASDEVYFSVIRPEGKIVFSETFDKVHSSNGNTSGQGNIDGNINRLTSRDGWKSKNAYASERMLKMGSSKGGGSLHLPALDLSADEGRFCLAFNAQAWKGDKWKIRLNVNDRKEEVILKSDVENRDGVGVDMEEFIYFFDNGTKQTDISFDTTASSSNRFYIDNIRIYQNPDDPDVPGNPDDPDVPGNPDDPDVPSNPDDPDVPGNPDDPDVPGNPDDPDVPGNPDDPDIPGNPDDPDVPGNPDDPDVPGNPDDPDVPGNPDDPDVPGNPDDPVSNAIGITGTPKIYPNPAKGTFYVEVPEDVRLEVFSLSGLHVLDTRLAAGKHPVDLPAGGMYVVRTTGKDGTSVKRVAIL